MSVEYRVLAEFPGYRISNDGTVETCWTNKGVNLKAGERKIIGPDYRPLKPEILSGYRRVILCRDGRIFRCFVHRLVLAAFVGPCPEGMEACHRDGNRLNNHLDNLRWDTRLNNRADDKLNGKGFKMKRGEENHQAKLTEDDVRAIRAEHVPRKVGCDQLARKYGVNRATINFIVRRKLWAHVT